MPDDKKPRGKQRIEPADSVAPRRQLSGKENP